MVNRLRGGCRGRHGLSVGDMQAPLGRDPLSPSQPLTFSHRSTSRILSSMAATFPCALARLSCASAHAQYRISRSLARYASASCRAPSSAATSVSATLTRCGEGAAALLTPAKSTGDGNGRPGRAIPTTDPGPSPA